MNWMDTLINLTDFNVPDLADAKKKLDAGDKAGCAEAVMDHFRTRQTPKYLFTMDDLRKSTDDHLRTRKR